MRSFSCAAPAVLGVFACVAVACDSSGGDNQQTCDGPKAYVCVTEYPRYVVEVDSCGKPTDKFTTCLGETVCVASSATEASCQLPAAPCDGAHTEGCSADAHYVIELDSCGEQVKILSTCIGNTACVASGDEASCQAVVGPCDGPRTQACDADARHVIELDSCGEPVATLTTCLGTTLCAATSATTAQCEAVALPCDGPRTQACDLEAHHVIELDSCGEKVATKETCLGDAVCIPMSETEADCQIPVGECDGPRTQACDEDAHHVIELDSCGERIRTLKTCLGDAVCEASSATEADCELPVDPCAGPKTTACDAGDTKRVYWKDACGEPAGTAETCLGDAVCEASSATEASCVIPANPCAGAQTTGCETGDTDHVYRYDACGTAIAIDSTCLGDAVCTTMSDTVAACQCPPLDHVVLGCLAEGAQKIDNPTELGPLDACGAVTEVTLTCPAGERCWWEWDEDGNLIEDAGAHCATSIVPSQSDSPFYAMGCDFDLYMAAQTTLPIDCRCNRSNANIQECRPSPDAWSHGLRRGEGPHTRGINFQTWGGGFISKASQEVFAAVRYIGGVTTDKPGAIYAFDYVTGDRRVVSGTYYDEAGRHDVGGGYSPGGEALPFLTDVEQGADGKFYAFGSNTLSTVEITRVDPATGDRTLVWRRQQPNESTTFGQCWSGRVNDGYEGGFAPVQNAERAFALAADGSFFVGWNNDGVGVIHISADGSSCEVLSRWASDNLPNVGAGIAPQYGTISGMLHYGGKVYVETKDMLLAIDDESGDRTVFSNVTGIGGIGETNFFVDETRQVLFACGTNSARKCSVHDLDDGNNAQGLFQIGQGQPVIPGKYPQLQGAKGALDNNNYTGFGVVAMDPDDPNILYFMINYGFVKYEIDTGNSYIMSM